MSKWLWLGRSLSSWLRRAEPALPTLPPGRQVRLEYVLQVVASLLEWTLEHDCRSEPEEQHSHYRAALPKMVLILCLRLLRFFIIQHTVANNSSLIYYLRTERNNRSLAYPPKLTVELGSYVPMYVDGE